MSFFGFPQAIFGNGKRVVVSDPEVANKLGKIVKELKKINIQLAEVTDNVIENKDLPEA